MDDKASEGTCEAVLGFTDRRRYRMTDRDIFAANEDFIICSISNADRRDYVELHRQLKGEASLYLNPVSKDMMWEQILKNADSVFSLFTAEKDYCGSIELQQPDSNTPEIGIDLLEKKSRNSTQGISAICWKSM